MADHHPDVPTLDWPMPESPPAVLNAALDTLGAAVLPAFLPRQRWFADKHLALGSVRFVDVAALDTGGAYLALVEIEQSHRMYLVPLAIGAVVADSRAALARIRVGEQAGILCDALVTEDVPRMLLADIANERRRPSLHGGTFVAHAAPALAALALPAAPSVRRLSVEQSNTSIVLGDAVMLKAYRRVHHGPQAELEVARFLDAVGYANTPALMGFIEYEHPDLEPMALCIVQQFAANSGDGWAVTLAYLERFLGRHSSGGPDAPETLEDTDFRARLRTLGQRTAELHHAFATPIGEPAFEPEPSTSDDLDAWVAQARATADAALTALEREGDRVPLELRVPAHALLARRAEIMQRLELPPLGTTPLMKTRFHGDFHLGQVLAVGNDFMIVDFEGEPGRDPVLRRRKSSPLRDVAGMLRSLDYAAAAGVRSVTTEHGEATIALERDARAWEQRGIAAFLDGYHTAIGGCSSYPSDPDQARRLLDLFVLEKAFYEMSYELANRPSWLGIPLDGIRAILDAGQHAFNAL